MDISLDFKNKVAKMKIEGAVTTDKTSIFQEKLDEILKNGAKTAELDFSLCSMICSVCIGKILHFSKEFKTAGNEFKIVKCSLPVYELFTTIKLNTLIDIKL